ncbi:hypothetical protein SLEP1_g31373 [Rubroshorea leprosula]|uniref:Uncharacterized protein n=1 Tax=Rubroshorea leprosula TaxID=152421 RepID=A0AAV5KAC6_9ROSI|nr:hypothetical protein SLEP1_g31373 [Rubroshorea leprosula]
MKEPDNDPIRKMVMDALSSHGIEYNMNEQANEEAIFEEAIFEEAMEDAKEFFVFCKLLTRHFMIDVLRVMQYPNRCLIL